MNFKIILGKTEENHGKSPSGWLITGPWLKPRTSPIESKYCICCSTVLGKVARMCVMRLRQTGSLHCRSGRITVIHHVIPCSSHSSPIQWFLFWGIVNAWSFSRMWRHDTCKSDRDQVGSRVTAISGARKHSHFHWAKYRTGTSVFCFISCYNTASHSSACHCVVKSYSMCLNSNNVPGEVIVPTMQPENTGSSQWLVLVLHATTPL
jgi:hypothetical protein